MYPTDGVGVLDMLHDLAKHPRVGNSRSFMPDMRLEVYPSVGGTKLGNITVDAVLYDKIGRRTGRLAFKEELPKGVTKGCLLLWGLS